MRRAQTMSYHDSNDDAQVLDDQYLLSRVRANDAHAFEEIFRAYYALLCSIANQYIHSRDDAQDAAQQVLFVLWRDRTTFQVRGSLKEYLCASVRNYSLNVLAHDRVVSLHRDRSIDDPMATEAQNDARNDVHARLEADERRARVARALSELPPRQRAVCTLRWIDGLSYAEIAQRLGISEKTIANQLTRALQWVRAMLGS